MQQLLGDEPSEVEDDGEEDDIEGVMAGDPKEETVEGETVNDSTQREDGRDDGQHEGMKKTDK